MKANYKKTLKQLLAELEDVRNKIEDLRAEHEDWKDDHDYEWEETPAGEQASEDQDNLQMLVDDIDNAIESARESFNIEN